MTPDRPRWPAIAALARHFWREHVYATKTYIFQAAFLLAISFCVFVPGGFYDSDFASLDILWSYLPWVAVVLVPALAMRSFSSDRRNCELDLMLTMPVSPVEIVVARWVAGTAILVLTLAMTFPLPVTVAYLGSPDWGQVIGGYVGAVLLLATFFAFALLASALSREETGAYVLAVAILLCATIAGSDGIRRFTDLPPAVSDLFSLASPKRILDHMATGRIELSALLNCVVLGGLALWVAAHLIKSGRASFDRVGTLAKSAVGCVAALAMIAVISTSDLAVDLTQSHEHTLHPATIAAAKALPAGATVDFYWSEGESTVPAAIRAHAHRVQRLLADIARRSDGRLTFVYHDAAPDTQAEWTARASGIQRVPLSSGDAFLLGATLGRGDRQQIFPYFDVTRDHLLEYDVTLAMTKLEQSKIPKVGLISPLLTPSSVAAPIEGLSFVELLKRLADVAIIPFFADALPPDIDVIVVIGGALLKPAMLYAIDQHVMHGHGLVVCLDPWIRFSPASNAVTPGVSGELATIADLIDRYGIRFDAGVTGDANLAAEVTSDDGQHSRYPFWLRVRRQQMSATHPVTASLNELLFVEPGALTLAPRGNATALIETTNEAGSLPSSEFKSDESVLTAAKLLPDGQKRTLAATVQGALESAFPTAPDNRADHLTRSTGPTNVFVIADVDWLFDAASVEGAGTQGARPLNDNHTFLANLIDAASGDRRLLEIRSRGRTDRSFTRVSQLLEVSHAHYRSEEANAALKIEKIDGTVSEILKTAHVARVGELPDGIRGKVEQLQAVLMIARLQLRDIRRDIRQEVDALGRKITIANVLSGPLLTLAFGALIFALRRRFGARFAAAVRPEALLRHGAE